MIDQTSQFFAMLTAVGEAKHANAIALGLDWMFTEMGIGDANDTNPIPDRLQTRLINEWRRAPINQIRVSPTDARVVITEQVIPADVGGKWIREIGLYDVDGDLVAVANCAPSFKPLLSQGTGKTQVVRMNFIVSSSANIILRIDPAVVLATREYVDLKIQEELAKLDHKHSVRFATTGPIALAGLDVQVGGDWAAALTTDTRVLVKDQAAAKDNGLYRAVAGNWVRTTDADHSLEVTSGLLVAVEQGTTLADSLWQLVTDGTIVLGTTALVFQDVGYGLAPIDSPVFIGLPQAPTPAQFDYSTLVTTTEFVRRQGVQYGDSIVIGGTGAFAMNASHIGGVSHLFRNGNGTITLPDTTNVPRGATVTLVGNMYPGVTVSLAAVAGKALRGAGGDTLVGPVTMRREEVAVFELYTDGGDWRLIGGTLATRYAAAGSEANFITPPQFDSSKALVTAEFVQRALGSKRDCAGINASRTLTRADVGYEFILHAVSIITLTLPDILSVQGGASIRFINLGAAPCTISAASDQSMIGAFDTSGMAASLILQVGDEISISRYEGLWLVIGSGSNASYGTSSGSRHLGGGLILQWGTISGPASPPNDRWDLDILFPRAFPSGCFGVVASPGIPVVDLDILDGTGASYRSSGSYLHTSLPTNVGFEAAVFYGTRPADSRLLTWQALGH